MSVALRPGTAPKGGPDAGATGMRSGRREMAIRSWRGFGRSGTSPRREVPVAVRGAVAGGAARERRGSGDRRAPSPVGPRYAPVLSGLRPSGLSIIKSRAEPSRAEPSRAEPSRAEPSRAEPSRAEPTSAPRARGGAPPPDLTHRPRPTEHGTPTPLASTPDQARRSLRPGLRSRLQARNPARGSAPLRIPGGGPLSGSCWRWRCSPVRPSRPRRRRSPRWCRISVKPTAGQARLAMVVAA